MVRSNICDNCICVPVCRNKDWVRVVNQCDILSHFLHDIIDQLPNGNYSVVYIIALDKIYRLSISDQGVSGWSNIPDEEYAVEVHSDSRFSLIKFNDVKIWGQKPVKGVSKL